MNDLIETMDAVPDDGANGKFLAMAIMLLCLCLMLAVVLAPEREA
jgi:hypothetical protein